ncbi:MAG: gliding motility protein GldN, partial [Prevotella sp.]|nr:gliding motility protein GldN [Prevotella sp.]
MKNIKNILLAFALTLAFSLVAYAQPQARKVQQAQQKSAAANSLTTRAQISYPIAQQMKEDVVWRRDIY